MCVKETLEAFSVEIIPLQLHNMEVCMRNNNEEKIKTIFVLKYINDLDT